MNNDFIVFLPNIILLLLFIIFLWRRHSLKNFDWVTLICITLGVFLLAIIIVSILQSQSTGVGLLSSPIDCHPGSDYLYSFYCS